MGRGCLKDVSLRLCKELFSWFEHSVIEEHNFISEAGARKGLIGKTGEKPARSRHCNAERFQQEVTEDIGKAGGARKQSQENCLFCITV